MENFPTVILTIAFIFALAFISKFIINKNNHHPATKSPPGPKPWPVLGNLNLIGQQAHLSLQLLSKKYGVGGIMQLKFGSYPVVVVSSPDMAKQFLKTHDRLFASRPPFAAGKYVSYNYSNILWATAGPYWRQARKLATAAMFSANRLDFYKHIRMEESRTFLSRLGSFGEEPVMIGNIVTRHVLSIVCRMVIGDGFFAESRKENPVVNLDEVHELVDEWMVLNGGFNIGDWIPGLKFVDRLGCHKKMKALNKRFEKVTDWVIDQHLARQNVTDDNDAVDTLLKLAQDPNLEVQLTRDSIKAILQDLLTGGTDSTIITIEWAVHEISKHPGIMQKAKEELSRVIGNDRWVTEDDLSGLPYMNAIIMETLRLHPPATLLPPHYCVEDCNVAGYDISKGTIALINIWDIGRDPNTWDAPLEFLPERFLGKEIDVFGNNFGLLAFGSGRRMCPGYDLGFRNVRMTVANMLQGFNWRLPEGMSPGDVSTEEVYGLTSHPKLPISIIMEPTLAV